jgi:hypothetical protein
VERTQISLEPEQADQLRRLARERGTSMAHLIRDAVDVVYGSAVAPPTREELWDRALRVVGVGTGEGAPVSEDHDRYLDESYGA